METRTNGNRKHIQSVSISVILISVLAAVMGIITFSRQPSRRGSYLVVPYRTRRQSAQAHRMGFYALRARGFHSKPSREGARLHSGRTRRGSFHPGPSADIAEAITAFKDYCTVNGWAPAFVNLVPEYTNSEIMVDLMRHRKVTESGTMDYAFTSIIERALHYVCEHINHFYNYKGLHAFKKNSIPHGPPGT